MGKMKQLWADTTVKGQGSMIMTSTPTGQNKFVQQYLGEWANDRPERILNKHHLRTAIKAGMSDEEILKITPIGMDVVWLEDCLRIYRSRAYEVIYA